MAKQKQAEPGSGQNGHDTEMAKYEKELAGYLQQRIKPGLNSGAIPLLARSIAKDIAHRERPTDAAADADTEEKQEKPDAEAEDKSGAGSDDEPSAESDEKTAAEADDETEADADDETEAEADDETEAEADDETEAEADDETEAEADEDSSAEADDEPSAEGDEPADFEADMHDLQAELGEDWILRFSVQGDDAWLTAEKDDGSQRVEAPTAEVLSEVVGRLNEDGGRTA
jgi:hypothetical protein